jgi:MSHA biogenesis protein MshP
MSTTYPELRPSGPVHAAGFTLVSMIFIPVVLAALGTAVARLAVRQHLGSAAELAAANAYQSAYAGLEWASWQLLRNPAPPADAPACFAATNLSFGASGLSDFVVTLSCARTPGSGTISDGSSALAFYQVLATACNAPIGGACPNTGAVQPTYVERQLSRTLVR